MDFIKICYDKVVQGNRYDAAKATQYNVVLGEAKTEAKIMPHAATTFVMLNHFGSDLHYALYLFWKLREYCIECYIAFTKDMNPAVNQKTYNHISVCYVQNGKRYIADPAETVKTGEDKFCGIPIEDYQKDHGTIKLYDPYGEHGSELFFEGFLDHPIETLEG